DPFGGIAGIRFYFRFLVGNDFHLFGSFLLCFFSNIIKINGEVNFDDFIKSAKMSHCERSEAPIKRPLSRGKKSPKHEFLIFFARQIIAP
ncbi:MAG: hypothetical protein NTV04_02735, partial [Deltaproteobacteria bacterium]|nr:hypothetical protein [Deltaproteobacteria bacterium]